MKFSTLFPVYDPSKKAHPQHEIRAFLDAERHEFWECHDSSPLWATETPKLDPERHEFWECHDSLALWATETPKLDPERHEFWECHDSSSLWAREMPQIQPQKTRILRNCTH